MENLLGFHPPHFSEEAAWLPGWLQSSTIREASNQAFQCPSGQRLEEIGCLHQNMCTRENENMSDNGGCKSFHLFLSGEENSTMNLPSCSSNHEVRYHLHLSSNGESQILSNPISSKSLPERFDFNQGLIVHQPDSKVTPKENTQEVHNRSQKKGNSGTSSGQEPLSLKGQNRKTPKSHKVDITDAVELAVAASEALIIHEVVKDEPSRHLSTPSSVLEAAIRVKQARLEELKETLGFEDSDEVDFLSDLDELTMADAYEDVGLTLTFTGHGDMSGYESISHVKDSYGGLEADFGSISPKQELLSKKGFLLEPIDGGTHKEDVDYAELGAGNADLGCDVDLVFSCSVEQPDFGMKEVGLQRVGFATGDPTSCQTVLRSSPGHNEREDQMTSLVPDRFQSRWFGGWTGKNEVTVTDDKHKNNIPHLFGNETSSLSESADIAPDMNSAIQKQENTVSQSSIAPKDTHERSCNNNDNLLLENVSGILQSSSAPKDTFTHKGNSPSESSLALNASPMDLLCSVVPCSFTSDTPPLTHHNLMSPGPTPQLNLDHPKTQNTHLPLVEKTRPILEINSDSTTVRRQVSSLKSYSMLPNPPYDPYLDKQPTQTQILDDIDAHNPSSKQDTELPTHIDKITNSPKQNQLLPTDVFKSNIKSCLVPMRKRVRFSEPEKIPVKKRKTRVKKHGIAYNNKLLLKDLKFLITGFSIKKHKEIKSLVEKNSGMVLEDIPSPPIHTTKRFSKHRLPLVLCPKRLLTTKFLYGCAVNACVLKVKWLFDSVNEGSVLPPTKYMILKENANMTKSVFQDFAIMLHGKRDFCTKMAKVIKHGGGLVFKTFHWLVKRLESDGVLVGAVVVEDENGISRHLKQCAVEQNIAVLNFDWVVKSLYAGRVVPLPEFKHPLLSKLHLELSEEI